MSTRTSKINLVDSLPIGKKKDSKMPFGEKVECKKCDKKYSLMWHHSDKGIQCNECHESESSKKKVVEEPVERKQTPIEKPEKPSKTKKSTKNIRGYKTRQNSNATPKQQATKGKSRRSTVFKKTAPMKAPTSQATVVTMQSCIDKGHYWNVGDIVSVRDVGGDIYYAQLTGFMQDQYCEKSASFTWLVPTLNKSKFVKPGFDPMHFVYGPESDLPYRLDCFEFVMHAPSDYWKQKSPFPSGMPEPGKGGFIWTRL